MTKESSTSAGVPFAFGNDSIAQLAAVCRLCSPGGLGGVRVATSIPLREMKGQ